LICFPSQGGHSFVILNEILNAPIDGISNLQLTWILHILGCQHVPLVFGFTNATFLDFNFLEGQGTGRHLNKLAIKVMNISYLFI